jgi:hypothetical protein
MDFIYIFDFLTEIAYLLFVFTLVFSFSIIKGRQAIINLIFGLYLALLISIQFPSYDVIFGSIENPQTLALAKLVMFGIITTLTTILCYRVMPDEFRENKLESFHKKFILSLAATILIMIFSFQVLPVTEFLTPGTPVQTLFAQEYLFFWWLLLPLVILFLV